MNLILAFLSGAFLVNSLPHLLSGVMGNKHMTPLAKNSSALVNVVWAYINILVGVWLFNYSGGQLATVWSLDTYSWAFLVGGLFMALSDAWLFSNPNAKFPWFK